MVPVETTRTGQANCGAPFILKFEGREWYRTGKTGTNIATGLPSVEYRLTDGDDERVWLNLGTGELARD